MSRVYPIDDSRLNNVLDEVDSNVKRVLNSNNISKFIDNSNEYNNLLTNNKNYSISKNSNKYKFIQSIDKIESFDNNDEVKEEVQLVNKLTNQSKYQNEIEQLKNTIKYLTNQLNTNKTNKSNEVNNNDLYLNQINELVNKIKQLEISKYELENRLDSKDQTISQLESQLLSNTSTNATTNPNININKYLTSNTTNEISSLLKQYDDEDHNYLDNTIDNTSNSSYINYIYRYNPFQSDIKHVHGRLGSSVASYIIFLRYVYIQFLLIFTLLLGYLIYHMYILVTSNKSHLITYVNTNHIIPTIALYSTYQTTERISYSYLLLTIVLLITLLTIYKFIQEDYNKKNLLSNQSITSNYIYAKEILSSWDHNLLDSIDIYDYGLSLGNSFQFLMNEKIYILKRKSRSQLDKLKLLLRRLVGLVSYICIQVGSLLLLIYLSINSENISNSLNDYLFVNNFSSIIVPITLSLLNQLTPYLLHIITEFEMWDQLDTTVNLQLIRIYISNIFNILIVFLTYILLSNPVVLASYPSVRDKLAISFNSSNYQCRLDQTSNSLFVFYLSNVFFQYLSIYLIGIRKNVVSYIGRYLKLITNCLTNNSTNNLSTSINQSSKQLSNQQSKESNRFNNNIKTEFKIINKLINIFDYLAICLLVFPYSPLVLLLTPLTIWVKVKWECYCLIRYYNKPMKQWKVEKQTYVFMILYILTICLIGFPNLFIFLLTKTYEKSCLIQDEYIHLCESNTLTSDSSSIYSCTLKTSSPYYSYFKSGTGVDVYPNVLCKNQCGPFIEEVSAIIPIKDTILSNDIINYIYIYLFNYTFIPWFLVIGLVVVLLLVRNTTIVNETSYRYVENILDNKIKSLEYENNKQEKLINRLKSIDFEYNTNKTKEISEKFLKVEEI